MAMKHIASIALLCLSAFVVQAATEEELFFKGTTDVNEGQLRFLTAPPAKPLYHFRNEIVIRDSSLADGWVGIRQCHDRLDAVPSLQIVYGPDRIRNLRILSSEYIDRSWAEASSIQMEGLRPGARLCVSAESRTLEPDEFGSGYILKSGPYMRRFLDGYYPMHVSLVVRLDTDRIHYSAIDPAYQPGFNPWQQGREVGYEAIFEGVLRTELRFSRLPLPVNTP